MDLDAWLPRPQVRTRHSGRAGVAPEWLWGAASEVRLDETRTLGRLVRWRIPGLREGLTFRELFEEPPFTVIDEGDTWSLSGLCGRIWTLERDYGVLEGPEDFRAWDVRGTARVLFAHWVEPDGDGALLHSEVRVQAVDRRASLRLRTLWALVGVFERRIGSEPVPLAVRRAERSARDVARAP